MQTIKVFHLTTHAVNRIFERSLSLNEMKDVVKYHQTRIQQRRGDHGGMVYMFSKTVDGKTLVVIAEVKKHEAWLISGWNE